MIRQGLTTIDEKAQEPLACDAHGATHATPRKALAQQAFDQSACVRLDEVLCEDIDTLTATVWALMVLFPVGNVPVFLIRGGLTSGADISDDHGFELTSTG